MDSDYDLSSEFDSDIEIGYIPDEIKKLFDLKNFFDAITSCGHYVAKSEYRDRLGQFKELVNWFNVLKDSDMLGDYCRKNNIPRTTVEQTLCIFENIEKIIDDNNDKFISNKLIEEKEYLDNILKQSDPNILLDEDQRRVVLTDEDYCLVVAGAGAGKTTTVAAKVKYLVDKRGVDSRKILVVSFTNKAVNELKQRINGDLGIDCPIATFHSTGNAILHKQSQEKLNIIEQSKLYYVIRDYFKTSVLSRESTVKNLVLFFASYFDAPYEGDDLASFFNHIAKTNYTSMRSEIDDFKKQVIDSQTKKSVTILSETLRSSQEAEIANFLYLNGIDYEYEPLYKYDILLSRKPYTPDFKITQDGREAYIEHFGITEDGKNDRYSPEELEQYKKSARNKILLHRQHGTNLLYTFSSYNDGKSLLWHLRELLLNAGFELRPRSNKEVVGKLVSSEENRYTRKLIFLICRFITNFKVNGYTADDFNRMYNSTPNVRTKLFLNICNDCYLEYQKYLKENNCVDFQDMINESARLLREVEEMKQKLDFEYVIVDEYQDISRQRFDLVSALHKVTTAKIIAVGDDWQSIYAFSGSDITLFTKFAEKMGYAKLLKIVRTYRNSQEVIDIAGNFIQKNKEQITKELISPKHIDNPVIIYTYDGTRKKYNEDRRSGANYAIAKAVETAIEQIIEYNKKEGKPENSSILLIGRYGFDGDKLEKSGLFEFKTRGGIIRSVKYPKLNITYMTAHSSKGLGYDNVIVVNGRNETYGFPSKIEDDPVLSFVVKQDASIEYAEERRLFYVAMTRTKNRVYFIAPEQNPSEFLLELKKDYKNVALVGDWNEKYSTIDANRKTCPMCGYPLQMRYKSSYGLKLYICTNEPEVCGFMTNNYAAGKLSIMKCDQCRDGYLIVKPGKEVGTYILGCTNYKRDGTGCTRVISARTYYERMDIKETAFAEPTIIPSGIKIEPKESIIKDDKEYRSSHTVIKSTDEDDVVIRKKEIKAVDYYGQDLNEIIATILQTLNDISVRKYYGIGVLTDVLRGSSAKKIISDRLNTVSGFGKMQFYSRDEVEFIIDWMIRNNYIRRTKGLYPVLHMTYEGQHYDENISTQKLYALKRELELENLRENSF